MYPQHECGLFAVFGHPNAAVLTYYGLFALQHRGQESAGIVTSNGPGTSFQIHKDMGLVSQVFGQAELELVTTLGPVVGTHAGPGTVGLFWFADD